MSSTINKEDAFNSISNMILIQLYQKPTKDTIETIESSVIKRHQILLLESKFVLESHLKF